MLICRLGTSKISTLKASAVIYYSSDFKKNNVNDSLHLKSFFQIMLSYFHEYGDFSFPAHCEYLITFIVWREWTSYFLIWEIMLCILYDTTILETKLHILWSQEKYFVIQTVTLHNICSSRLWGWGNPACMASQTSIEALCRAWM